MSIDVILYVRYKCMHLAHAVKISKKIEKLE